MYQMLSLLSRPCTLIFLVGLVMLAYAKFRELERTSVWRWWLAYLCLVYLYFMPLTAYFAMWTLEKDYPRNVVDAQQCDAIVILGGGANLEPGIPNDARLGRDTLRRCLRGEVVASKYPELPVVVTGGRVDREQEGLKLAEVMKHLLVQLGISEDRIVLETDSANTYENAIYTRRTLPENVSRIVLVTDAAHMRRSKLVFERAGFEVVPASAGAAGLNAGWSLTDFLPNSSAPRAIDAVWHEWLGLLWYRIKGYI